MAAVQKELLERTVTRLQEELSTAQREKEAMREDLAHFKKQVHSTIAVLRFALWVGLYREPTFVTLLRMVLYE